MPRSSTRERCSLPPPLRSRLLNLMMNHGRKRLSNCIGQKPKRLVLVCHRIFCSASPFVCATIHLHEHAPSRNLRTNAVLCVEAQIRRLSACVHRKQQRQGALSVEVLTNTLPKKLHQHIWVLLTAWFISNRCMFTTSAKPNNVCGTWLTADASLCRISQH